MKRERHLPELTWPGKQRTVTMGEAAAMGETPALSRVEVAGDLDAGPPRGRLIRGDNRAAMRALLSHGTASGAPSKKVTAVPVA